MTRTFLVSGWHRESQTRVRIIIDAEPDGEEHAAANKIAGPEYMFNLFESITATVPDRAKNIIFASEKELFKQVPELNPWR